MFDAAFKARRILEPMCALDPLLLIPRIEYAEEIYEHVLRQAELYSLVILDMTNFHLVNDIHGYNVGDAVIEGFIHRLRSWLPAKSISLRFRHGDEFLFFIPGEKAAAEALFASIRQDCETRPASVPPGKEDIFVSFRYAVLEIGRVVEPVESLLLRAEKALRLIKKEGSLRA